MNSVVKFARETIRNVGVLGVFSTLQE